MSRPERMAGPESIVRLLTVRELAQILSMNEQTIYRLVRRGAIPSIRVGPKLLRFDLEEVRKAMTSRPEGAFDRREAIPFTTLDEVRRTGVWPVPPSQLEPSRFQVKFPGGDLTTLAYDREGDES